MNDFEAIDQLLAAAAEPVPLPLAEQRRALVRPSVSRAPKWPAPST